MIHTAQPERFPRKIPNHSSICARQFCDGAIEKPQQLTPMKKLLLVTAIALSSVFIAVPHTPAQTAQFTFTPLTSLTVNPGDTVQFSIFLNYVAGGNIPEIGGLTYFLQQISPTSPLSLSITRRDHGPGDNPGGPGDSLFES